jgi:hypothetical protein
VGNAAANATHLRLLLGDRFMPRTRPGWSSGSTGAPGAAAKREWIPPDLRKRSADGEHGLVTSLIEKPMRPRGNIKGCGFYALQPEICDYIARTPRTALRDEYEFTLTLDLFVRDGNPLHAETMAVWDHNFTYPFDVLDCNLTWLTIKLRVLSPSAVVGSDVARQRRDRRQRRSAAQRSAQRCGGFPGRAHRGG